MDSFYDMPRKPPIPTAIDKIERKPGLPEVSVVMDNLFITPFNKQRILHNYNNSQLKNTENMSVNTEKHTTGDLCNKSHLYSHHAHIATKQVRFKNSSPALFEHCTREINYFKSKNNCESVCNTEKENLGFTLPKLDSNLSGKTFKQIYMANVPNRHLDLSILEPCEKEVTTDKCDFNKINSPQVDRHSNNFNDDILISSRHSEFSNKPKLIESDTLKSIENIGFMNSTEKNLVDNFKRCDQIAKPNDEPTIKDLYNIIQQQNEQIMLLQRQINNLKTSIRQPETDSVPADKSLHYSFMKEITNSPTKKGLFSIDLKATSFEVSFRPQHNKFRKQQNDFLEPKIQEIVESDSSENLRADTNQDISLHLEDSFEIKNSYLSPPPSIQINMDEYQSSEDEDPSGNIGISFYQDLMDQVNNVLKKMKTQSECQMPSSNKKKMNYVTGQTMKVVKQATLQHLKSIGVNLSPIQESNELSQSNSSENQNFNPTEVSFMVKQLLMKYLPDDKLTKAINKPKETPKANYPMKHTNKATDTEFSFATLQYLKKYNIIDSKNRVLKKNTRGPYKNDKGDTPKILDVTALKMQPKLL